MMRIYCSPRPIRSGGAVVPPTSSLLSSLPQEEGSGLLKELLLGCSWGSRLEQQQGGLWETPTFKKGPQLPPPSGVSLSGWDPSHPRSRPSKAACI